jgi:hypothetical protein
VFVFPRASIVLGTVAKDHSEVGNPIGAPLPKL